MSLKPIQYTDLSVQVYERIKAMILSEELKPGEKIKQEHIARTLGISRMPLHKAFQILEDEMLVESIPRRGIFVRNSSIEEYIEAFECREVLEGLGVRKASKLMKFEEIIELRNLFVPFIGQKQIDVIEYRKADQIFHEAIIRASNNKLLQKLNKVGNVLFRTFPKGILMDIEKSLNDHFDILKALEERNPDKAEGIIKEHVRMARYALEEELKKNKS